LADARNPPDADAVEFAQAAALGTAIGHGEIQSGIADVVNPSTKVVAAPKQNLDGRAGFQLLDVFPVVVAARGQVGDE
jgi:hypothetical protein